MTYSLRPSPVDRRAARVAVSARSAVAACRKLFARYPSVVNCATYGCVGPHAEKMQDLNLSFLRMLGRDYHCVHTEPTSCQWSLQVSFGLPERPTSGSSLIASPLARQIRDSRVNFI